MITCPLCIGQPITAEHTHSGCIKDFEELRKMAQGRQPNAVVVQDSPESRTQNPGLVQDTLFLDMPWVHSMSLTIRVLEDANDEGKQMAREELMKLAKTMDHLEKYLPDVIEGCARYLDQTMDDELSDESEEIYRKIESSLHELGQNT